MATQRTVTRKANPTWSRIAAAREKEEYIPVGPTAGSNLALTGAEARLAGSYPNIIYVPEFSLVGEAQDLISAITSLINADTNRPYTVQEAQEYIANGYNARNITVPQSEGGRREDFESEMTRVIQARSAMRTTPVPTFTLDDLEGLVSGLEHAAHSSGKRRAATGASPGRRGARIALAQRVANLAGDKVLDVSAMTPEGVGVKTIGVPGQLSAKIGVNINEIPIVSSDPNNYARAIQELGYGNSAEIIDAYNQIFNQRNQAGTQAAQRTTSTRGRGGRQGVQGRQAPVRQAPVRQQMVQPPVYNNQVSPPQGIPQFPTQPNAQAFGIQNGGQSLRNLAASRPPQLPALGGIRQNTGINVPRVGGNNPIIGSEE